MWSSIISREFLCAKIVILEEKEIVEKRNTHTHTLINGRSRKNVKFGEKSESNLRSKRGFAKVESKYDLEP